MKLSPNALAYKRRLLAEIQAEIPFPRSLSRPNPLQYTDMAEADQMYSAAMPEYMHPLTNPARGQFINGNSSIGHKLHLNVRLDSVRSVSDYLKGKGYEHKYLMGGGMQESGKIFTIYIGPHGLAFPLAEMISWDIRNHLCNPLDTLEIEYAPFVSGRFRAAPLISHQYPGAGLRGITLPNKWLWINGASPENVKKFTFRIFDEAFELYAQQYGEFFHG